MSIHKQLMAVTEPLAKFLDAELKGDTSFNKLQALSKLQEAVWWAEKHLSETKDDVVSTPHS